MVVELGDPKGYLANDGRRGTWGKNPGDDAWRSWYGLGVHVVDLADLDGPTQNITRGLGAAAARRRWCWSAAGLVEGEQAGQACGPAVEFEHALEASTTRSTGGNGCWDDAEVVVV